MSFTLRASAMTIACTIGMASQSWALVPLLTIGDPIVAIDLDDNGSFPAGEGPGFLFDNLNTTKYLNFGEGGSGVIVTPGASIINQLLLTTANDAEQRDPTSYVLEGTNDVITTQANGSGNSHTWSLISSGTLVPPTAPPPSRGVDYPLVTFANATSYTSYRLYFPTIRDAANTNSLQLAEVQLRDSGGVDLTAPGNPVVGIRVGPSLPSSNMLASEPVQDVIDGDNDKYLNFSEENSGFIVTPSVGQSRVLSFTITTANDAPERDPSSWALYGTNETVTTPNNGVGNEQNWTLIDSGTFDLTLVRNTISDQIQVDGAGLFTAYRMVFPTVRNAAAANSMQVADIQFYGNLVPEPTSIAMMGMAAVAVLGIRRRLK